MKTTTASEGFRVRPLSAPCSQLKKTASACSKKKKSTRKINHEKKKKHHLRRPPLRKCSSRSSRSVIIEDGVAISPEIEEHPGAGAEFDLRSCLKCGFLTNGREPAESDLEEEDRCKVDDLVDINDLLFTPQRNYLVTNKGDLVKPLDLKEKVVVIYFLALCHPKSHSREYYDLVEAYQQLWGRGGFEIVLILVGDVHDKTFIPTDVKSEEHKLWYRKGPQERFEEALSCMPWPAIPYFDRQARSKAYRKLVGTSYHFPAVFILDPTGKVLHTYNDSFWAFSAYGAEAFPFTGERIRYVNSQDAADIEQPSLEKLLATSDRDFVISCEGKKVPISDLKQKVVGLYLYENLRTSRKFLKKLKAVYEELKSRGVDFEVVLVYLHCTFEMSGYGNEDMFWNSIRSMPWLALPYKDPNCRRLRRIFGVPDVDGRTFFPIIGPHGSYLEIFGGLVLKRYGLAAYPFTREKAVELVATKLMNLKLDSVLCKSDVLRRKDGSKIHARKLWGKKVLLLFATGPCFESKHFMEMLETQYNQKKDTADKFEVVHVSSEEEKPCSIQEMLETQYNQKKDTADKFEVVHVSSEEEKPCSIQEMPWFVCTLTRSRAIEVQRWFFKSLKFSLVAVVAFGSQGEFVAKESLIRGRDGWNDTFPFITKDLRKEILDDLTRAKGWWERVPPYWGLGEEDSPDMSE